MAEISYGVSFSIKYAQELGLDWQAAFEAVTSELSFKRLRLMSYWDSVETKQGIYNFRDLDWQLDKAKKRGIQVTLSVGMRQPRYPECHIPTWAKDLLPVERNKALYNYLEKVIVRYQKEKHIESWQLENEALNKGIGECTDYDRERLRYEYNLIKKLDPQRPVIMSTSDSFGLPMRRPKPDIVGFSLYLSQYRNNRYYYSKVPASWFKLRKFYIGVVLRKPVIIHELQAEPWGPRSTAQLPLVEQYKSMNPKILKQTVTYAKNTDINHIDLWGAEWWYWLKIQHNDSSCWDTVKRLIGGQ